MTALPPSVLIVVAGGRSSRMGVAMPKPFIELAGRAALLRALDAFAALDWITTRIAVVPGDVLSALDGSLSARDSDARLPGAARIGAELRTMGVLLAAGGERRQDSVLAGLQAVSGGETGTKVCPLVMIHDAARPFVSRELIERVARRAAQTGAALPGLAVTDTIKRAGADGLVRETIDRTGLWAVQTPQAFSRDKLLEAYARFNHSAATDDAALYERLGLEVAIVEGSRENIKLTTPGDLAFAEHLLARRHTAEHRP